MPAGLERIRLVARRKDEVQFRCLATLELLAELGALLSAQVDQCAGRAQEVDPGRCSGRLRVAEGEQVVSGSYRAISRDLGNDMAVKIGKPGGPGGEGGGEQGQGR